MDYRLQSQTLCEFKKCWSSAVMATIRRGPRMFWTPSTVFFFFIFVHVKLLIHSKTSLVPLKSSEASMTYCFFLPIKIWFRLFFHTCYCPIIAALHSDGGIHFPQPLFGVYFICRLEWTPVDYCAQEAVKSLLRPWTTRITTVCPFNKCHQGQTSPPEYREKP